MDAYELTRPILSVRGANRTSPRPDLPAVEPLQETIHEAARYVRQLALGAWAGAPLGRARPTGEAAARALEVALWRVATSRGIPVSVDESPVDLAVRLARSGAIAMPAADAAVLLLPVLAWGGPAAAKSAIRLVGYLDHRAALAEACVSPAAARTGKSARARS